VTVVDVVKKTYVDAQDKKLGFPIVVDNADRAAQFPAPLVNQRVHNLSTDNIEMWTGSVWKTEFLGTGGIQSIYYTSSAGGTTGDSVADDRAKLNTLFNVSMQPAGGKVALVGILRVGSNLAIPANIEITSEGGGYLAPDVGVTITHSGTVTAALKKIFGTAGVVALRGPIKESYPQWWGAVGDGVANDYPAFKSMHDASPPNGMACHIPVTAANTYRLGTAWNWTRPLRVTAALASTNAVDSTTGTVLYFDADKRGVIINNYITIDQTTRAADINEPGANYARLSGVFIVSAGSKTGLLNGGTGIIVEGLTIRAPGCRIESVRVQGFRGKGVKSDAQVGGGGALEGNDNITQLINVSSWQNGDDGFYWHGNDSNACYAESCDATDNDGWGFNNESFLGNGFYSCHASGNVLGPYRSIGAVNASKFDTCYQEAALGMSHMVFPTMVVGGNLANSNNFDATTTAFIFGAGISFGAQLKSQIALGVVQIGSGLATNDALLNAFTWGSSDDTATLDAWKLTYDNVTPKWDFTHRNAGSRQVLSFPAGNAATLRAFAPNVKNGLFLGAGFALGGHIKVGSAPPVAGTWLSGDIVINDYTVSGSATGIDYWWCVIGGTPGTWVAHRKFGTFALAAAATTVIADTNTRTTSRITFTPTSAAAATLMQSTKSLYLSARVNGTSFSVTTADGTVAAGETFDYVMET
jgi:hypothetical protein